MSMDRGVSRAEVSAPESARLSTSLLCRAGTHLCALPLPEIVETMRPLPVQALAGSPTFLRGLALIRGTPTPVVDLEALLDGSPASGEPAPTARFVTVQAAGRCVALAVTEVVGLRDLSAASLVPLPPLLGEAPAELVEALGTLDAELLLLLRGVRWIPQEVWSALQGDGSEGPTE